MEYLPEDHTFSICAYKESPFLEECILSLSKQSVKSNIIMCTSTPNEHIRTISHKYNIPLYINERTQGIAGDWNFAYHATTTPLVTLAHQDDVYDSDYVKEMLVQLNRGGTTQIGFTDYYEIQDGKRVDSTQFANLKIKRLMLLPLRVQALQSCKWIRRRILSLGNPIGCPSVTYVKGNLPEVVFQSEFSSNLDWITWEKLSKRNGRFLYIPRTLMGHRMYADSTTVKMINSGDGRTKEDYEMLKKFWPKPIAKIICKLYTRSQKQRIEKS